MDTRPYTVVINWNQDEIVEYRLKEDIKTESRKLGFNPSLAVVKTRNGLTYYRVIWDSDNCLHDIVECTRYDRYTTAQLGSLLPITEEEYAEKVKDLFPRIGA